MRSIKLFILTLFSAALLWSCDTGNDYKDYVQRNKVLILNQGNYTEQNSSICVYDENTRTLVPNAFSAANGGTKLGATLMSGTYSPMGLGYLLCSNPDKIEVIDMFTMRVISSPITEGLLNTREIAVSNGYIFVTNAGDDPVEVAPYTYEYPNSYVSIYSATDHRLVATIPVGTDAQGLIALQNSIFVGTKEGIVHIEKSGRDFYKNDVYTDEVYTGAVKYLCGTENRLFMSVPGYGVLAYTPYENKVLKRYELPLDANGFITVNPMTGDVYSIVTTYNADWSIESSKVYKLNPDSEAITEVHRGEYLYSVGVSPASGHLFTSEANGFTTNSTLKVIDMTTGDMVNSATVGVGTFRYLFYSYLDEEKPAK